MPEFVKNTLSSYKHSTTTIYGLVTAGAAFVLFDPDLFAQWPWVISLAKFVTIGGLAGLGIAAADGKHVERAEDEDGNLEG